MLAKEIGRHIYQNLNVPICFSKRHSPAIPIITKKRREPKPSPISLFLIIYTDYSDGAFHVAALSVGDVARTVTGPDCCVERRMRSS